MQIHSIQNYNKYLQPSPTFGKWYRTVYQGETPLTQKILHKNNTWLYREESFWRLLCYHLAKRFNNIEHINVYNYACSNGMETYTFLMELISNYKEDFVKKFLPIKAMDYDPIAIAEARTGILEIENIEKDKINEYTRGQFNRFFEKIPNTKSSYRVQRELTDNVIFSVADIREDYKKIEPINSLVLARNFWPYLGKQMPLNKMAKKLYEQMDKIHF